MKKKIDKNKVYLEYMKWVDEVTEECDWKTHFEPKEIVSAIVNIIQKMQNEETRS